MELKNGGQRANYDNDAYVHTHIHTLTYIYIVNVVLASRSTKEGQNHSAHNFGEKY
jgi:hypothetical protein